MLIPRPAVSYKEPEVVAGHITATRAWKLKKTDKGWRLHGCIHEVTWPAGEALHALCMSHATVTRVRSHFAPSKRCQCGIYGTNARQTIRTYLPGGNNWLTNLVDKPVAIGTVRLWGKVSEHAQGYRASHAYPDRLWVPTCTDGWESMMFDLLAYRVPVDWLNPDRPQLIAEEAIQVLADWLQ